MNASVTILSTKVLAPQIIEEAENNGIRILNEAFIEINIYVNESLVKAVSHSKKNIVFTSANAVKGYLQNAGDAEKELANKNIYCLQGETLKAVKEIPGVTIAGTAADATALGKIIISEKNIASVSFFCGDKRRDELPSILKKNNIEVEEVEVYQTKLTGKKIETPYYAVLFFSPSAAESFFYKNILPANNPCFCIGTTTADAVKEYTKNEIIISTEASQQAILRSMLNYYTPQLKNIV